jgi:hypothetical protein
MHTYFTYTMSTISHYNTSNPPFQYEPVQYGFPLNFVYSRAMNFRKNSLPSSPLSITMISSFDKSFSSNNLLWLNPMLSGFFVLLSYFLMHCIIFIRFPSRYNSSVVSSMRIMWQEK